MVNLPNKDQHIFNLPMRVVDIIKEYQVTVSHNRQHLQTMNGRAIKSNV